MTTLSNIQTVYDQASLLIDQNAVEKAIDSMAESITTRLGDQDPTLLCVLQGGIVLMGGLLTRLNFPLQMDYAHLTRYGHETSGGTLEWIVRPQQNMQGRTLLIVDDILDGGLTLNAIVTFCQQQGAKQVYTAVLVDKPTARQPGGLKHADFCALQIDDHFVFGYGMDYQGYWRNAAGIYAVMS